MRNKQPYIVDISLKVAYFCVNCEIFTNNVTNCLRCGGPLYPFTRWFSPIRVELGALHAAFMPYYKVMLGNADNAVYCRDWDKEMPERFDSLQDAQQALFRHAAVHLRTFRVIEHKEPSMFLRLRDVACAYDVLTEMGTTTLCIKRFNPADQT